MAWRHDLGVRSMNEPLDFFLFLGSTYTYLAVNRADQAAAAHGVTLRWQPFSARSIMLEQNNRPFVGKPVKLAYMWRDVERRARQFCIPIRVPAPYPLKEMALANQIAFLGAEEGWCSQYAVSTYRQWFQAGWE